MNATTTTADTLSMQVASLEDGYANLLEENQNLGNEVQDLTKAVRELEDQQAITRQAYQNLLAEKDGTIAGLDATVAAKLKHITLLDEALAQAREANATLDHRLEQQNRRTTGTVSTGSGDPGLSHPYEAERLERTGPVLTYADVRLARHIRNNIHYSAIRLLLGVDACRMLDAALRADNDIGVSD